MSIYMLLSHISFFIGDSVRHRDPPHGFHSGSGADLAGHQPNNFHAILG